ncbi:uncharacterized protein METZ01_LOCUS132549, partial [marine metagenome]
MINASHSNQITTSWLVRQIVFFNKGRPPSGMIDFLNVGHLFPPAYRTADIAGNPPITKALSEPVLGLLADRTQASKAFISAKVQIGPRAVFR